MLVNSAGWPEYFFLDFLLFSETMYPLRHGLGSTLRTWPITTSLTNEITASPTTSITDINL